MKTSKPTLPYSVGDFMTDVKREFRFLTDDYGFAFSSRRYEGHTEGTRTLTTEDVSSTNPSVKYRASMRRVVIAHDPRGAVEVFVTNEFPSYRRVSVQEMAEQAGDAHPERYGEIYNRTETTAAEVLHRHADGLKRFGDPWLRKPSPE